MKSSPFEYCRPESLMEVLEVLTTEGAQVLAGGQSLVPLMAMRLARPEILVDIKGVKDLSGIKRETDGWYLGATTKQEEVQRCVELLTDQPIIRAVVSHVAHPAVRSRGTIGGSLAHADPAAEWPALAVLLDGSLKIQGPHGVRWVQATEFFLGSFSTALRGNEVLIGLKLPLGNRFHYDVTEVCRRKGDFALAGCIASTETSEGVVRYCRTVMFGVGPVPTRLAEIEQAVVGLDADRVEGFLRDRDVDLPIVMGDIHASESLRRRFASAVVRRAIVNSLADCTGSETCCKMGST